jgi:hypothetical protein
MSPTQVRALVIDDPQGGRNRIRKGDPVRVLKGGADKTGFNARFECATVADDGALIDVTVWGGARMHERWRTVTPERIKRKRRDQ